MDFQSAFFASHAIRTNSALNHANQNLSMLRQEFQRLAATHQQLLVDQRDSITAHIEQLKAQVIEQQNKSQQLHSFRVLIADGIQELNDIERQIKLSGDTRNDGRGEPKRGPQNRCQLVLPEYIACRLAIVELAINFVSEHEGCLETLDDLKEIRRVRSRIEEVNEIGLENGFFKQRPFEVFESAVTEMTAASEAIQEFHETAANSALLDHGHRFQTLKEIEYYNSLLTSLIEGKNETVEAALRWFHDSPFFWWDCEELRVTPNILNYAIFKRDVCDSLSEEFFVTDEGWKDLYKRIDSLGKTESRADLPSKSHFQRAYEVVQREFDRHATHRGVASKMESAVRDGDLNLIQSLNSVIESTPRFHDIHYHGCLEATYLLGSLADIRRAKSRAASRLIKVFERKYVVPKASALETHLQRERKRSKTEFERVTIWFVAGGIVVLLIMLTLQRRRESEPNTLAHDANSSGSQASSPSQRKTPIDLPSESEPVISNTPAFEDSLSKSPVRDHNALLDIDKTSARRIEPEPNPGGSVTKRETNPLHGQASLNDSSFDPVKVAERQLKTEQDGAAKRKLHRELAAELRNAQAREAARLAAFERGGNVYAVKVIDKIANPAIIPKRARMTVVERNGDNLVVNYTDLNSGKTFLMRVLISDVSHELGLIGE